MADATTMTTTTTAAADAAEPTGAGPESRVAHLESELDRARTELAAARAEAARAERARRLTLLLAQARAVDLDAALLLAERMLGDRPDADPAQAVRDLRRQKPHLFRIGASATVPPHSSDAADDPAVAAARAARAGDRRALLDYLRARRA